MFLLAITPTPLVANAQRVFPEIEMSFPTIYIYIYYYYKKQSLPNYNFPSKGKAILPINSTFRYIQHAHFLPRQHSFGTTLLFTGPVPANSRQWTPSVRNCVTR